MHLSESEQIISYFNSDFAADKNDRHSVSDLIFKFTDSFIFWASCKQKSVMILTAEAELMTLILSIKHAI